MCMGGRGVTHAQTFPKEVVMRMTLTIPSTSVNDVLASNHTPCTAHYMPHVQARILVNFRSMQEIASLITGKDPLQVSKQKRVRCCAALSQS